jgi:hypothetical protein
VQRVRRTRREAEAALLHARSESDALRADLATYPAEMRQDPAFQKVLARLEELDAAREAAFSAVRSQAGRFEN